MLAHELRQATVWLTFDVRQNQSMVTYIIIGCGFSFAVVAVVWLFKNRDTDFPYIYNPAAFVSTEDIRQIEHVVRAKGERYIVSINIISADKAGATTGHGSLRPSCGRRYFIGRTAKEWTIDKVEEWKN